MWLIRDKQTEKYVYRYFGSRWTRTDDLEKATQFKTAEEARNWVKVHTSCLHNIETGEPITPEELQVDPDGVFDGIGEVWEHRPEFHRYEAVEAEITTVLKEP